MMRIEVDLNRCEGHGICEAIAPDFFSVDDDGTLSVLSDDVQDDAEEVVRNAVMGCPVSALKLHQITVDEHRPGDL
jgi:ferredoxin